MKPPASQGTNTARALDNLLTFARGRTQAVAQDLRKLGPTDARASGDKRMQGQALRALLWGTAGGYVADTIYREVTGRSSSPYEPGALLVDNLNLGGLMNEGPEVLRRVTRCRDTANAAAPFVAALRPHHGARPRRTPTTPRSTTTATRSSARPTRSSR